MGKKKIGSPKLLFKNLDLTPIHPILWTDLHIDGPGRPVEYNPEYSGAMMSLGMGSSRLGGAMGSALGGLVLTLGGYSLLGIASGLAGIVAFLVIFLNARDPSHIVVAQPTA